jgi:hypothetical protein
MPFILGSNSVSGYTVKNSLRFEKGSSDYLSRTPSGSGSTTTWTYSLWVKRSVLNVNSGNENCLFTTLVSGSNYNYISFSNTTASTSDRLMIRQYSGATVWIKESTQQFRDTSGWYHLVFVYDSSNATASDRVRMYVNGSRITSFAQDTNPTQNTASYFNTAVEHRIGQESNYTNNFFNGYMSEIYFINAQALDPTSFGETDEDTGIWKPKAYTGTYGTNGFYLQFKNSSSLGTDSSGNGNTFTVNNLTSIDQTTDTPTNNFGTLNPLAKNTNTSSSNFSNGNLELISSGSTAPWVGCVNTIPVTKGKWYAEYKVVDAGNPTNGVMIGVTNVDLTNFQNAGNDLQQSGEYGLNYYANSQILNNGSTVATYSTMSDGDIVMIALDIDNGKVYWGRNGTWENSGVPTSGATGTGAQNLSLISTGYTYAFNLACRQNGNVQANFGNPSYSANSYTDGAGYGNFSYSVPSGYYSLNTRNLANFG